MAAFMVHYEYKASIIHDIPASTFPCNKNNTDNKSQLSEKLFENENDQVSNV